MAQAILDMREFFADEGSAAPEGLLDFLLNKVLLIYVSTEDREDAFRLFTILNDRGLPLRNSDILKSMNIGALEIEKEKTHYAKMWEEAEGELGDDFDRFLNYIRTILVKDKARTSLLQEFEEKIYASKGKEKSTSDRTPLLKKGKETFRLVERYLGHYGTVLHGQNYDEFDSFEFDNLVKVRGYRRRIGFLHSSGTLTASSLKKSWSSSKNSTTSSLRIGFLNARLQSALRK